MAELVHAAAIRSLLGTRESLEVSLGASFETLRAIHLAGANYRLEAHPSDPPGSAGYDARKHRFREASRLLDAEGWSPIKSGCFRAWLNPNENAVLMFAVGNPLTGLRGCAARTLRPVSKLGLRYVRKSITSRRRGNLFHADTRVVEVDERMTPPRVFFLLSPPARRGGVSEVAEAIAIDSRGRVLLSDEKIVLSRKSMVIKIKKSVLDSKLAAPPKDKERRRAIKVQPIVRERTSSQSKEGKRNER